MKARRISGKTSYSPRLNKNAASFHTTSPPPPPHLLSQSVSRNPFNTTRPEKALFPSLSLSDLIAGGHPSLACPCRQCPLAPLHPRSRGVGLGLIGKQKNNQRVLSWKPAGRLNPPGRFRNERFPILLKHRFPRPLNNHVRLRAAAPIPRAHHTSESQKTLTMMMN